MIDDDEWDWIVEHSSGEFDHLVIASTLPVFLLPGIHHIESWNEAVCAGALGRPGREPERADPARVDLEHWPASTARSSSCATGCGDSHAAGEAARPPASILLLGGDVHTDSVSEVELGVEQRSRVHQLVCSPFRNPLSPKERRIIGVTGSRLGAWIFGALARLAGVTATLGVVAAAAGRHLRELAGRTVPRGPRCDRDTPAEPAGG